MVGLQRSWSPDSPAYPLASASQQAPDDAPSPAPASANMGRPRILIVKLTSLGDVIKALPVVNDIRRALPEATLDWAVERPFDSLLALHPAIDRVIPLELRRYRKERRYAAGFVAALRDLRSLRAHRYDLIVDLQGRMKSALVAALARGPVVGQASGSMRERHHDCLYRKVVPRAAVAGLDAVSANRALAALALGYPMPIDEASYGLRAVRARPTSFGTPPSSPYAVLVHGSSRSEKCWPEARWFALGRALNQRGIRCLLPWGNASEEARARRLASRIRGAVVPQRVLELVDWAGVLAAASLAVGVDSGLTHLAAACGAPTIGIFQASSVAIYGIEGRVPHRNLGDEGREVSVEEVVGAADALLARRAFALEFDLVPGSAARFAALTLTKLSGSRAAKC